MPNPSGGVVKKALKISPFSSGGNPTGVSLTEISGRRIERRMYQLSAIEL